jgi:hypothetical protein
MVRPEGKSVFGRPRHRHEIDLKEIGFEGGD